MLNWDRVWSRVSKLEQYRGKKQSDYRPMVVNQNFTVAAGVTTAVTRVDFASGAIILGIQAGATLSATAGTQAATRNELGLFSVSIDYANTGDTLTTGGRVNGRALFEYGNFPAREVLVPYNGSLNYQVESLITGQTLIISFAHHCMVDRFAAK